MSNAISPLGATILVPVDFDEPSRRAVRFAAQLANELRGRLVLLHVVPPTALPEGTRVLPVDAADPVDISTYVSERARRMLEEHFTATLVSGTEVRMEARTGHVVETILRAIEESPIGLVIVGTHGRTGTARFLLGSVAENVVRRSPVPVLVVRDPEPVKIETFTAAATVSGVVAGAATGALAGPAGALAGGAIGGVVGAIAGAAMTRETARTDARDRVLDDAIGVTHGSLGTPNETKVPSPAVLAEAETATSGE